MKSTCALENEIWYILSSLAFSPWTRGRFLGKPHSRPHPHAWLIDQLYQMISFVVIWISISQPRYQRNMEEQCTTPCLVQVAYKKIHEEAVAKLKAERARQER